MSANWQQRLCAVRFTRVFTSPLQRARRTCELAGLDEVAEIEPDLAEWDYGDYEGQRPADIRKARPDWNVCRDGSTRGKSPAQVFRTADRLIAWLQFAGDFIILAFGKDTLGNCQPARQVLVTGVGHRQIKNRCVEKRMGRLARQGYWKRASVWASCHAFVMAAGSTDIVGSRLRKPDGG